MAMDVDTDNLTRHCFVRAFTNVLTFHVCVFNCIIYFWYIEKNILADKKFSTKFTAPKIFSLKQAVLQKLYRMGPIC